MQNRISILATLKSYLLSDAPEWQHTKQIALQQNGWFTEENINLAVKQIVSQYLDNRALQEWISQYSAVSDKRKVGIIAAGNIPLVVFHDFLCVYVSGHCAEIKLSSKDSALFTHLHNKFKEWDEGFDSQIKLVDQLKNCDAFIATGNNNSARYFEAYFGRKPCIIRKNRTSVAVLNGHESDEELIALGDDVFQYFGLGCRNVTQLCVPEGYDFTHLLKVFSRFDNLILHHKYKNNYDYYLAVYLLNKVPYWTNNALLMVQNDLPFSAVSVLHYRYYDKVETLVQELKNDPQIQIILGVGGQAFGTAQQPGLNDYADGVNTMEFLMSI